MYEKLYRFEIEMFEIANKKLRIWTSEPEYISSRRPLFKNAIECKMHNCIFIVIFNYFLYLS